MIHVHGSGDLTPEWICSKGGASASFDFIKMASGKHKKYKEFLVFCETVYQAFDLTNYVIVIETQKIAAL